jgi:hypothetical protein
MKYYPRPKARGARNHQARLREAWVRAIRRRHRRGESFSALAYDFGVSSSTISRAVNAQTWRHVAP